MPVRGADLVVEALLASGVRHLFSLSGNQILSIYDATVGRDLSIVHTRHEAAAVHMADAWGRLTEQPGVALVTAAPGHLNALSALYGALMAESPVVLLSGHAPLGQAGRGAFQEVDQVTTAAPVTKAAWLARDSDGLGQDIARALSVARAGRPGPVHVSLPSDLLEARVSSARRIEPRAEALIPHMTSSRVREFLQVLAAASRPLILVGPALARSTRAALVGRFSASTGIPVLPMESPRGVGDPSLHLASGRLAEADVVLLLGKRLDFSLRFGEPPAFSPDCRFLQIDVDAPSISAGGRVALAEATDPLAALEALDAAAPSLTWRVRAWAEQVAVSQRTEPPEWNERRRSARRPLHPLRVCSALQPRLDAETVLVCDGGEFGQWAQAGLTARTRLINGPSGSIGSAIPMACAAQLAQPRSRVVALLGDGTFGFHGFELDTAVRHRLPILTVIGNDARWNAEHQLQLRHFGADRTIGCQLLLSRYDLLAEALGAHGEFVVAAEALEPALDRALASGRPACVNVAIEGVPAPEYRTVDPGTNR
jgi:acetolactate synthase-1/2/3 large subunit